MSRTFLFVANSPYSNHGSEAIVRGTVEILRRTFDDPRFVSAENEVYPYCDAPETDPGIIHKPVYFPKRRSLQHLRLQATKALLGRDRAYELFARRLVPEMDRADAVMFLGGDAFIGKPYYDLAVGRLAIKRGKTTVLWGASVGPFTGSEAYNCKAFEQLKRYSAIFIREEVSKKYLADNGVSDNVHFIQDPAFMMQLEKPTDAKLLGRLAEFGGSAVGVSLSRLFLRHTPYGQQHMRGAYEIIEAIRQASGRPLVLVSHCVADYDDDYALLNGVLTDNAEKWPDVICLPKLMPPAQIKWVISKLDAMVGARTHSTIAAFGTCTPTVSLVYSFKGEGLNRKLFGSLDYLVRKEDCTPPAVVEKLNLVLSRKDEIRRRLEQVMPHIQAESVRAGTVLKGIIENSDK